MPSKALLAAAKVAHQLCTADRWGLPLVDPARIDTSLVWRGIRAVQDRIAAIDDDPDRFAPSAPTSTGARSLVGPHEVEVGQHRLENRFILLCTGSRPAVRPIAGLDEAGYLTWLA